MAVFRIVFMIFIIIAILSGCDRNTPDNTEVTNAHQIERELVLFDSIGIEMGDSNYVFGIPRALEFTSLGNIVVGDISKMKLTMYSPDGMFIRRGGSCGQGPGEYTAPTGISPTRSGGIMVADAMGGKLIFYDSLLNYSHELSGFAPRPPGSPEIQIDGSIVGISFVFDQEAGSLCNSLNRWESGETEASFSYLERTSDFDQQNPRKVFQETGINFRNGRMPSPTCTHRETEYGPGEGVAWNPCLIFTPQMENTFTPAQSHLCHTEAVSVSPFPRTVPVFWHIWQTRRIIRGYGCFGKRIG